MISKERLTNIALAIIDRHGLDISMQSAETFAHALIKAVEAESEVVGYRSADGRNCSKRWYDNHARECDQDDFTAKLIALPLVEE